eukprot:403371222
MVNITQPLLQMIRSQDRFGKPITLNYKGNSSHKTILGGFFSCVSKVLILLYFAFQLQDVWNRKYAIENRISQLNLEKVTALVDKNTFDFAVNIFDIAQYKSVSPEDIERYLNIVIRQDVGVDYTTDFSILKLELCQEGRLKNNDYFKELMRLGVFKPYCPVIVPTVPQSFQYTSYSIAYDVCNQTHMALKNKTCASNNDEIKSFIQNLNFKIFYVTDYFDIDEFDKNPLKSLLKSHGTALSQNFQYTVATYLSQDVAIRRDSMFASVLNPQTSLFYTEDNTQKYFNERRGLGESYYQVFFEFSSNVHISERTVFTIVDALSTCGGIMQILPVIIGLLINNIQEYLFFQKIFQSNFKVLKKKPGDIHQSNHQKVKIYLKYLVKWQQNPKLAKYYEKLIQIIMQSLQKFTILQISIREYFGISFKKLLICKKIIKYTPKENMILQAKLSYDQETDISNIMKNLNLNNYLLSIIFNIDQLNMAKFMSQKVVSPTNFNQQTYTNDTNSQSQLFEDLARFIDKKNLKSKYSQKLLTQIIEQDQSDNNETLRQKLFRGIARQVILQNMKQNINKLQSPTDNSGSSQIDKSSNSKQQIILNDLKFIESPSTNAKSKNKKKQKSKQNEIVTPKRGLIKQNDSDLEIYTGSNRSKFKQ